MSEEPLTEIETVACSRCGGTGKHSFCTAYLDICFKCSGKGVTLTKRGAAANEFLKKIRSKPACVLAAGDEIWIDGIPGYMKGHWATVEKFEKDPLNPHLWVIRFTGSGCSSMGVLTPTQLYRVRQSKEGSCVTWMRALAFQDTLTKTGTPKKTKKVKK